MNSTTCNINYNDLTYSGSTSCWITCIAPTYTGIKGTYVSMEEDEAFEWRIFKARRNLRKITNINENIWEQTWNDL